MDINKIIMTIMVIFMIAGAGFLDTLANNIATFKKLKDMNYRGKVLNVAFATIFSRTIEKNKFFHNLINYRLSIPLKIHIMIRFSVFIQCK